MNSRPSWAALMLALAVAACEPGADEVETTPPATIPVVRLAADSNSFAINSGYETPATLVLRDSAAWAGAWATLHGEVDPLPVMPVVNFATDMMVLVAIGQQPNGGHAVYITSSTYDSTGAVLVRAEHVMPGSGCMTSQALVEPVDVARIPQTTATVLFEVTPVTRECGP